MLKNKEFKFFLIVIISILVFDFFYLLYISRDAPPPEDSDMQLSAVAIPEEENAFYDFNQAVEKMYWPVEETEKITKILEEKEWDEDFVEELLEKNKETFSYFEKSLACPIFQLPEFQDPSTFSISMPFRPMEGWRNFARLISIKALYLFNQNKEKEAFDETMKLVKTAKLIEDSPLPPLIQVLLGSSMKRIGLETLRAMIPKTTLPPEILESYVKELSNYKANKAAVKNVFRGEYMTMSKEIERYFQGDEEFWMNAPFYLKLMVRIPFYYKKNQTKQLFLEDFRSQIENFGKDYYKELRFLYPQFPSLISLTLSERFSTENFIGKLLYEITMVDLSAVFVKQCQEDFSLFGTQLLMAIKAYKIEKGGIPASLEDLIPEYFLEIPKDPFDGNQIRFSPTKKIIYSVGDDLEDSGGSEAENWEEWEEPTLKIEF